MTQKVVMNKSNSILWSKKALLLALLLICFQFVFAGQVLLKDALTVAENHLDYDNMFSNGFYIEDFNVISDSGNQLAYIFNLKPQGYIVVASDTRIRPVIAYSYDSDAVYEAPGDILVKILKLDLGYRLNYVENAQAETFEHNELLWNSYLDGSILSTKEETEIIYGPWITTTWGQSDPYNRYCPVDPETGDKCPSGCTITAISQILNYWEYPYEIRLDESDSYVSDGTSPGIFINAVEADLDTIVYNPPGRGSPEGNMIASIMRAVGICVEASYASWGTGAFCWEYNFIEDLNYLTANEFRGSLPRETLEENMIQGKPMWVAIYGPSMGHAIVADGLNEAGAFHLNMGWNGAQDGWYFLLDDGYPSGFDEMGYIIGNIVPPSHPDFANNMESATEIFPNKILQKKINAIEDDDDVDWYVFSANEDSTYVFYSSGPNDMWLELYTESGELIDRIDAGGDNENFHTYYRPEVGMGGRTFLKVGAGTTYYNDVNYRLFYTRATSARRPFIEILYPTPDVELVSGGTKNIIFLRGGDPFIDFVSVEYSLTGPGGPYFMIADSVHDGVLEWNIPETDVDLTDCWLRVADMDGEYFDLNDEALTIVVTSSITENNTPDEYTMQTYPNPFNSTVNISLPQNGTYDIVITGINGQIVEVLNGESGTVSWSPGNIDSGIYLVKVQSEEFSAMKKISYIK